MSQDPTEVLDHMEMHSVLYINTLQSDVFEQMTAFSCPEANMVNGELLVIN